MDHAINSLKPFLEVAVERLTEEHRSGEYSKLSDCPHYHEAKALVQAIHVLEKYEYGETQTMSVKALVEW